MTQYDQPSPDDIRFQFEIIKGLGESVRSQTDAISQMQSVQIDIVERLARIEARDSAEMVRGLQSRLEALEADKQRRDGASGVLQAVLKSPVTAWLIAAIGFVYATVTGKT